MSQRKRESPAGGYMTVQTGTATMNWHGATQAQEFLWRQGSTQTTVCN